MTKICMAGHWRMLLGLGLIVHGAECDVDRGRSVIKRNVLELANLPMEGYFRALYAPLGWFANLEGESLLDIDETLFLHVQR